MIRWLKRQKIGDLASFNQVDIDAMMAGKKGTPTMGGALIIASIVATTLVLADLSNFYVRMALVCVLVLGAVGAVDDWLKLTAGRRAGSRQGLSTAEKLLFQIGLGIVLSIFTYRYKYGSGRWSRPPRRCSSRSLKASGICRLGVDRHVRRSWERW